MNLIKVTPRGYCKGVVRAIQMAKQARQDYPNEKITVLGMLVHNQHIVDALALEGIQTIEDKHKTRLELLDEIEEGVVLFTAHGVSDQVRMKAEEKGLIAIDASCSDVIVTANLVRKYIELGYMVAYIGKNHHPEAEAILSIDKNVQLIEHLHDKNLMKLSEPLFVTNQTTMSTLEISDIFSEIKEQFPNALFSEEICNATRIRQVALLELKNIDCLLVIGDRASNNSNQLAQIGKNLGIQNVYLVESLEQLQALPLNESMRIAITSGASTPTYLTNQMIAYLENQVCEAFDIKKILQ